MAKENRGSTSKIPPTGIKYKDWARKTNSSHKPTYHGDGGYFSMTCPSCKENFNVGVKAPKNCPSCKTAIDGRGYVQTV